MFLAGSCCRNVRTARQERDFGAGVAIGGYIVTTTDSNPLNGTGTAFGFNAGDASHNDTNPITEGYAFRAGDTNVVIDGLLANSAAGQRANGLAVKNKRHC